MLDLPKLFGDGAANCKFAVILGDVHSTKRVTFQALGNFGVLDEFRLHEASANELEVPQWAGNRDFDVKTVKIALLGSGLENSLTYYFCNLDDCWSSLVMKSSKLLDCVAVVVRSSPSFAGPDEYVQELTVLESGARSRVIRVGYDDGWKFFQSGPALPFEQLSMYTRRRVVDRLS